MSHMSCRITFYIAPSFNPTVNSGFPSTRINLSPFTKDFRGGKKLNESIGQFFVALPFGGAPKKTKEIYSSRFFVIAEHEKRKPHYWPSAALSAYPNDNS